MRCTGVFADFEKEPVGELHSNVHQDVRWDFKNENLVVHDYARFILVVICPARIDLARFDYLFAMMIKYCFVSSIA